MSQQASKVRVEIRIKPTSNNILDITLPHQISIGEKTFTFDHIHSDTSQHYNIFNTSIKDMVDHFLNSYNCTIFAYGQTGSGKTHTMGLSFEALDNFDNFDNMQNYVDNQKYYGIVPDSLNYIFEHLEQSSSLHCSFIEVYNEEVFDLLSGYRTLLYLRNVNGETNISGSKEIRVNNKSDVIKILKKGINERTVKSTKMNLMSSRSHAIFTLTLHRQNEKQNNVISKFSFVDLAGSERMKRTEAIGQTARESISINGGLLALSNVITALSKQSVFVPYRDSKLTRILQHGLGGNSITLMLANISGSNNDINETCNTLKYAQRATNISNDIKKNVEIDVARMSVLELKKEIIRLKSENIGLKNALKGKVKEKDEGKLNELIYENNRLKEQIRKLMANNGNNCMENIINENNELKKRINNYIQYEEERKAKEDLTTNSMKPEISNEFFDSKKTNNIIVDNNVSGQIIDKLEKNISPIFDDNPPNQETNYSLLKSKNSGLKLDLENNSDEIENYKVQINMLDDGLENAKNILSSNKPEKDTLKNESFSNQQKTEDIQDDNLETASFLNAPTNSVKKENIEPKFYQLPVTPIKKHFDNTVNEKFKRRKRIVSFSLDKNRYINYDTNNKDTFSPTLIFGTKNTSNNNKNVSESIKIYNTKCITTSEPFINSITHDKLFLYFSTLSGSIYRLDKKTHTEEKLLKENDTIKKIIYIDKGILYTVKNTVKIYNGYNTAILITLIDEISEIAVKNDFLCVGTTKGALFIFNVHNTEKPIYEKQLHDGTIFSIENTNNVVYTGSRDHRVGFVNSATCGYLNHPHYSAVEKLLIDDDKIISLGRDGCIKVFKDYVILKSLAGAHTGWIRTGCIAKDSFFSGGKNGVLKEWVFKGNELTEVGRMDMKSCINCMVYDENENCVYSGCMNSSIYKTVL